MTTHNIALSGNHPLHCQLQRTQDLPLRQIPRVCCFALGILLVSGCMGLENRNAQKSSAGPWSVMEKSAIPYGHRYEFGPFETTGVGVLQGSEIRKAEAPATTTVRFASERPQYAYEVRHLDGEVARIRTGPADTGAKKTLLQKLAGTDLSIAGSVEMDGKLIGEFVVQNRIAAEQPEAGVVHCSVGEVTVVRRREPVPQPESRVAAWFQPDHEMKEHYLLGGEIVATRRYMPREIWIDSRLPRETQLCIAAAMTVPLKQESVERAAAQGSLLSTSAQLAPSG